MSYLYFLLELQLSVGLFDGHLGAGVRLNGELFTQRTTEGVVFYDWIADSTTGFQALEIHLSPDDHLVQTRIPLSQIWYIDTKCFVRVWFTQARGGIPLGKEAFGDMCVFEAGDGPLALVVGIEEWLSPVERRRLLTDLHLIREKKRSEGEQR